MVNRRQPMLGTQAFKWNPEDFLNNMVVKNQVAGTPAATGGSGVIPPPPVTNAPPPPNYNGTPVIPPPAAPPTTVASAANTMANGIPPQGPTNTNNAMPWDADQLGDIGGGRWNPQTNRWESTGAVLSVGHSLGNTGVALPVAYNSNADTSRFGVNGTQESNWRRVNRWTGDNMRLYGMNAQDAYNASLSRLKRDYERGGADWRSSGFDLTNIQAMNTEAPQPGVNYVIPPNGGQQVSGGPPVGRPQTPPPLPQVNPGAGGGGQVPPPAAGGQDNGASSAYLAKNPQAALYEMFKRQGIDLQKPSPLTNFLQDTFAPLLQAKFAISGTGADGGAGLMENAGNIVGQMGNDIFKAGGAGGFFGGLRQEANNFLGNNQNVEYMNGLQDQTDSIRLMQQAGILQTAGYNPLTSQAYSDELQRQAQYYTTYQPYDMLQNPGQEQDPFMTYWNGTPYSQFFRP